MDGKTWKMAGKWCIRYVHHGGNRVQTSSDPVMEESADAPPPTAAASAKAAPAKAEVCLPLADLEALHLANARHSPY